MKTALDTAKAWLPGVTENSLFGGGEIYYLAGLIGHFSRNGEQVTPYRILSALDQHDPETLATMSVLGDPENSGMLGFDGRPSLVLAETHARLLKSHLNTYLWEKEQQNQEVCNG